MRLFFFCGVPSTMCLSVRVLGQMKLRRILHVRRMILINVRAAQKVSYAPSQKKGKELLFLGFIPFRYFLTVSLSANRSDSVRLLEGAAFPPSCVCAFARAAGPAGQSHCTPTRLPRLPLRGRSKNWLGAAGGGPGARAAPPGRGGGIVLATLRGPGAASRWRSERVTSREAFTGDTRIGESGAGGGAPMHTADNDRFA